MLISMPTGTSTIFGVFQAISALLVDRTNSALPDKLVRNEKFASEIFGHSARCFCCIAKTSRSFAAEGQTNAASTGSNSAAAIVMRSFAGDRNNRAKTWEKSRQPQPSGFRPMPRYFFNTRVDDALISDPEGEELRNADRAWEVARAMIRELLKTDGAEGALLNAVLEVTDDRGEIVLEFPFTEAILDFTDISATRH
jgi:hypothetical protein